jgi:hypothetical protein
MYAEAMRVHDARWDDGGCQFNVTELDDATIERLRSCRQRHGPGLAVLGDSHAIDIFIGMDRLHEGDFVFGLTFWSCWLGNPRRNCDFETFASLLEHEPGIFRRVLFHQAGFRFLESVDGRTGRGMFERVPEEGAILAEKFRILGDPLDEGVGYLLRLSELTELVWIGPRIEPHIGLRFVIENGCDHPYRLRDGLAALFSGLDAHLAAFAGKAGVKYVSLIDEVGLEMPADFMTCDEIYWRDGDHWSLEGAERFVGRLVDATQIAFRSSCNGSATMCTPSVPCCTE